jgi:hypothetical protein
MEIRHRISINSKKDIELMQVVTKYAIAHKTVESPGGSSKLITFIIDESDQRWPTVSELVTSKEILDMSDTYFSDYEIRNADWLRSSVNFFL